jgi:hypothetical protein
LVLFAAPSSSPGQVPFDACRDRQDRVIQGVVDNTMPYAGMATEQDGVPVILWNQKANRHLSTTEQIFIYLHECAHHTLGHLYRYPYDAAAELEADCWAIQLMVDGGMLKLRHLELLEESRRTVRADAFHLGGEAHVQSLERCLEVRTDQKAWTTALEAFVRASQDSFVTKRGRVLDSTSSDTVYESLLDAPGTFDCEVIKAALRCVVFAARKPKPAEGRFERLVKIVRSWLPVGWTFVEQGSAGGHERSFLAQDGMNGTLVTLALSGTRVYLLVKRAPV